MRAAKRRYLLLLEELRREKERVRREMETLRLQQEAQAQAQHELEQQRKREAELEQEQQKQEQREREREREELQRQKEREEKPQPQQRQVAPPSTALPPPPPPPPPPLPAAIPVPAAIPAPAAVQPERRDPMSVFEERIFRMHDLASSGDLTSLQAHLEQHPEDYIATDPRHCHCGLLHSSARGWQVEVLCHLNPTALDIVSLLDAEGNNLINHAAMGDVDGPGRRGDHSDQVATLRFLLAVLEESEEGSGSSSAPSWSAKKAASRKSTSSSHVSFRFFSSAPSALISHATYLSRSRETYEMMEAAAQDMMSKTVKRSSLHGTSLNSNTLPSLAQVKGVLKAGWLNKR